MTLTDADYMARALFHAARGRGRTSPNPAVGAVVVSRDGVIVGYTVRLRPDVQPNEIAAWPASPSKATRPVR